MAKKKQIKKKNTSSLVKREITAKNKPPAKTKAAVKKKTSSNKMAKKKKAAPSSTAKTRPTHKTTQKVSTKNKKSLVHPVKETMNKSQKQEKKKKEEKEQQAGNTKEKSITSKKEAGKEIVNKTAENKTDKKIGLAEEEPLQEAVVIELTDVNDAEVDEEEVVAPPPAPKMTKREKQIAKQLQAKAIAKARAIERAKLEEELLKAAEASSQPIARSKSGRVSYKAEYVIKSSPTILFEFVTTPSGLVQWFADKVDINGDEITFNWKGSEDTAIILEWIEDERVRYRWSWSEDDEFFQFRIYKNDITGDTVLEIIDFCEEGEIEDQKRLWDTQIKRLIKAVGGM